MNRSSLQLRRLLLGNPIPNHQQQSHKLGKIKALAIFSSDALSSVAYATEEMLNVLIAAGVTALSYSLHISIFISVLIIIVGVSYRQAIKAYPRGGGAYTVARENLGRGLSLIAAAALLIDYILTVAVSVTAGVRALCSAFPILLPHAVILSVIAVILIAWMNLRGTREAGTIFAIPTYLFVGFVLLLIGIGAVRYLAGDLQPINYQDTPNLIPVHTGVALSSLLILRAFSSGCSAMTGIEAVSNGVQAFEKPAAENAMKTLTCLMVLLVILFMGTAFLAVGLHIRPSYQQSVLSQIGHALLGSGILYYGLQAATVLILLLAANTSFAGFPALASMISQDNYLPRQLKSIGDRLAFSNGIILLALIAIALIIAFNAETHALIPLYSIGVFIAFTLCQAGLVKAWFKKRSRSWWLKVVINGFGCLCTAIAVVIIAESKFTQGAWVILAALPIILWMFYKIHRHYKRTDRELAVSFELDRCEAIHHKIAPKVVVPVSKIHKGTLAALRFAKTLSDDVTALAIDVHSDRTTKLKTDWQTYKLPGKLVVLESPYQSITDPLITRIRRMDKIEPERGLTIVVMPRSVPNKWWHQLLHNNRTFLLKLALTAMDRQENKGQTRLIIDVPYQLH